MSATGSADLVIVANRLPVDRVEEPDGSPGWRRSPGGLVSALDPVMRENDGVWIATTGDRHAALRAELPSMRSIPLFGPGETGWQWLPEADLRFEQDVLRACALIRAQSPLIGKVPKSRRPKSRVKKKSSARKSRRPARRI